MVGNPIAHHLKIMIVFLDADIISLCIDSGDRKAATPGGVI